MAEAGRTNTTVGGDMQLPGVSVIIPAYNYARFLTEAIDSVLAQDFPRVELIVVDDGSTDNTRELVMSYGDRVRYVYQENAGLSAARNTGIRHASHPFVAFLDADDLFLPHVATRLMRTFAELPPEFAVVACNRDLIDGQGQMASHFRRIPRMTGEVSLRDILVRTRFPTTGLIARRSCFDACGYFDTTLRSSEDRDMWIRIAAKYRIWYVSDVLVYVRRHDSQMSKHAERMKENVGLVLHRAYALGLIPRWHIIFWCKVFSYYHAQAAWMYHDAGRRWTAVREMLVSVALYPIHADHEYLLELPLFRLRALCAFLRWRPYRGGS